MTKFLLLIVVITLLGAVVTNLYPETDYYKKAKMKKGAIKHAKHRYRSKNYSKRAGCYQKKFRRYKLESKTDILGSGRYKSEPETNAICSEKYERRPSSTDRGRDDE